MNALDRIKNRKPVAFSPSKSEASLRLQKKVEIRDAGDFEPQHAEVHRICGLPVVQPMSVDELEEFNREHILAAAYRDGFRLFPIQANALHAYQMYDGLFGPIGVGWGKTLLTLMIANHAYKQGIEKMVLFVPPELALSQLIPHDIPDARTKVEISYPIHILAGRNINQRRSLASSGKKGLYIMPYSLLSTKDTHENIEDIAPQLVIGDEAHRLSGRAARARRAMDYVEANHPHCVFVSGTITAKSVMDYYRLIRSALGQNNPLPNAKALAQEWGVVIDAGAVNWSSESDEPQERRGPGSLLPLVSWAQRNFRDQEFSESVEGFRAAYRQRLVTCPGVCASGATEIGTSLVIANRPVPSPPSVEGWDELKRLVNKIEDMWLTPNDDEIDHAIHKWKWLNELSAGFYNQLVWPTIDSLAQRRNISDDEAAEILDKALEHHEAGQEYAKLLRDWIERHAKPMLDTPFLVGADMARNGSKNVPEDLFEAWVYHKNKDFEGRPERDSHAVRVCPYKIFHVADWAEGLGAGGVIWYHHQEIGKWMHEELCNRGMDALHCPAGQNDAIVSKANKNRLVVASITAHGTGKNLQHFQHQAVIQWPRSAKIAEQMLGRLHRNGQKADEIEVFTCSTTEFDHLNFAACLNDALYIHQTTSVRQKMIYAGYDPRPKIFPSAVLRERGAESVKILSVEQRKLMEEKFGGNEKAKGL